MKKLTKKNVIYCGIVVVLIAAVVTFSALWATAEYELDRKSSYFEKKCNAFALENSHLSKGQIVFIGDSITDYYKLDDYYADLPLATYNRGIGGDKTGGLLSRLEDSLFVLEPTKISLLIGINDVNTNVPDQTILANYESILDGIKERLPEAEVFCISILPINPDCASYKIDYEKSKLRIPVLNEAIRSLAEARGYQFLNIYPLFADEDDYLIAEYATDGLHLTPAGYEIWTNALKPKLS